MSEAINASTPPTAIPTILKGRRSSQTIGYKTRARRARGQHKTNKMHQTRNFNMANPEVIFDIVTPF